MAVVIKMVTGKLHIISEIPRQLRQNDLKWIAMMRKTRIIAKNANAPS